MATHTPLRVGLPGLRSPALSHSPPHLPRASPTRRRKELKECRLMPSSLLIRAVLNSTMMPMWACCRSRSCGIERCTWGHGQCCSACLPPEHPDPGSTVCQPGHESHGGATAGQSCTDQASSTGCPGPEHPLRLPSWRGAPCPNSSSKSSLKAEA